jgi:hypothetical protein
MQNLLKMSRSHDQMMAVNIVARAAITARLMNEAVMTFAKSVFGKMMDKTTMMPMKYEAGQTAH